MKQIHITILILLISRAFSQTEILHDSYLKFDHLTKKDGLSNNRVLDIHQDKQGFVWIGTVDGLNRYNAYNFVVYRNNINDSLSISGNIITSIAEDIFGGIWFGTDNGLNKYDYETNEFRRYYHKENNDNTIADNFIRALYADNDGVLWIETSNGTLHKYNIADNKIVKYKHRSPQMTNTYFYHNIFEDKQGYLWLGGRNMGILKFNPLSGLFHEILPDSKDTTKKRERDVTTYFLDSSGTYWVSGIDGLYTFDIEKEVFSKVLPISTFSIQEDKNGKLWIGTGSGVYTYDVNGNIFTKYTHSENNLSSLIADDVNKIMIDFSGNIWVGTNDGISKYSPTKNKFKHIFHIPVNNNTPTSNYITALLQDKQGNIWLGTDNDGVDYFDENYNLIAHYGNNAEPNHKIISNKISVMMEDNEGDVWIGQWSGRGFNIIDNKTKKASSYSKINNSLKVDWYNDLLQDKQGNFWIGIWGGVGLQQFDKEMGEFKDETFTLLNTKIRSPLVDIVIDNNLIWLSSSNSCFSAFNLSEEKYNMYFPEKSMWLKDLQTNQIFLDNENKLWYATNKGLYNKIQNPYISFKHYLHDNKEDLPELNNNILAISDSFNKNILWIATPNSIELFNKKTKLFNKVCDLDLKNQQINFIFEDVGNQLWIGTQYGLYLMQSQKRTVTKYEGFPFVNIEQTKPSATCYLSEKASKLWIGTSVGLFYYDKSKNQFVKSVLLADYEILSLSVDKHENMWVGTNKGLFTIKQNNIIASYVESDSAKNSLPGNLVFSLGFDENGNLWIGTNKGLCQLNKKTGTFLQYYTRQEKYLSSHLISCLFEDGQSNIWVGTTNKGLNKIEANTGKIISYKNNIQDSTAFWGRNVTCIMQDKKGNMWFGGFGLNKYIENKEQFIHYTETNGLVDNAVMGILEDNFGKLWISTKNGLSKFDPQTGDFQNFFIKDGLQDNEFTQAAINLKSGYLMFGGKNGLNVFNPEKINKNLTQPAVTISDFLIFDKETNFKLAHSEVINLKYNQNYFSFEFAALDYSSPKENKYAYKLENFDEHWIVTDANDRKAKYTNVPPGEYNFRIKASNNDGVWNETRESINIIISPPFWKTLWFYFLEALLVILAIMAYIKYREKNIKEKNKLLLLEQKLLRSQMNPHFIFNSLTSIQSFIFENNPIEAGSYLSRFSDLIRSILYNSREEYISLEKEISTLENYLEIQQIRYNNKFDYSIDVDPEIDIEMLAIPPMLAQPFIENSVEHGIRHIEGKGIISVKYSLLDESVILVIQDNGIGIEASKKMKNKKAQEHKSLAMIITKERIDILNNKMKKKSYSIKIKDIIADSNNSFGETIMGTKVEFVIPLIEL